MSDIGLAEYAGIGEAVGIIGTLLVVLYYSRKQLKILSTDMETKVLDDVNERMRRMVEMVSEKPELLTVLDKNQTNPRVELVFAYYVLQMFSFAFHMHKRELIGDSEWIGWMRWMISAFEHGSLREYWQKEIEPDKWFDPDFQDFIDNDIIKSVAEDPNESQGGAKKTLEV